MSKFLTLETVNNEQLIVNVDKISFIQPCKKGTYLCLDDYLDVVVKQPFSYFVDILEVKN